MYFQCKSVSCVARVDRVSSANVLKSHRAPGALQTTLLLLRAIDAHMELIVKCNVYHVLQLAESSEAKIKAWAVVRSPTCCF